MLECTGGIDAGQIVELEFAVPGTRQRLKLMGKVIRGEAPNRVGVEFIEPEPNDQEALERFIMVSTEE